MNSLLVLLLFLSSSLILHLEARPSKSNAHIIVMGFVYCDICSNNTFSKNSYFLPGAEVRIDCMFKAMSPRTSEQISFSVNRTTNKYGIYKLEIPSVDGIKCAEESAKIASSCQASLMWSSSSSCNVPGYKDTSDQIAVKSKRANLCIYSLNALSFRPSKKEASLCGNSK
ncbi:hypothetical protein L484_005655 [Morus notabilis]|uniref:Uncharacterized protein n=1 Tax=Morus notabilis TaxID=981085 RepID=W9SH38_9ROSA|nr:uncharacterized protein LOC21389116 [Morus notabilis]EXC29147.1 hypothetical protein L484_005655 [Morus notabilis]